MAEDLKVVRDKLDDACFEYKKFEGTIHELLEKLPNWGDDCDCEDSDHIDLISYGHMTDVMRVCTHCGGYKELD